MATQDYKKEKLTASTCRLFTAIGQTSRIKGGGQLANSPTYNYKAKHEDMFRKTKDAQQEQGMTYTKYNLTHTFILLHIEALAEQYECYGKTSNGKLGNPKRSTQRGQHNYVATAITKIPAPCRHVLMCSAI